MNEPSFNTHNATVAVVIPALNEEPSIGKVVDAIPAWVSRVVVGDNGSTDRTREIAERHGATVVREDRRGYGSACLKALAELKSERPDVVVFLDADFADDPARMGDIVRPVVAGEAELVIGSRVLGDAEPGALTPQQRYGNALACWLIRSLWGVRFTDLGPYRAIRWSALQRLEMDDKDWGWTVQMQVRAAKRGIRCIEVPVPYRRRIGRSKISGTITGVFKAGTKILWTIFEEATRGLRAKRPPRERVIVMTRWPQPGKTKTRMIPALGADGAAALQLNMTRHVLGWVDDLRWTRRVDVEVRFAGGDTEVMTRDFGKGRCYVPQGPGDLGERMAAAFEAAFESGDGPVAMIGCDCPTVTADALRDALVRLHNDADVVLGPARDGGYYLIGLRRMIPDLFTDVDWGSDRVLEQTLAKADRLELRVAQLEPRGDVDDPEDLDEWERAREEAAAPEAASRLGVVIPTLNEEDNIRLALDRALAAPGVRVIVVDGGSEDRTTDAVRTRGGVVIEHAPGRAGQMNAGAAAIADERAALLFCHADTQLPEGYERIVRATMSQPGVVAGAFTLRIDDDGWPLRMIEWMVRWRCRLRELPYGDQAMFVRRDAFELIGGFRDVPVMEDYDLVTRLRRLGRIVTVDEPVTTSARTWRRAGVWRTTAVHQLLILGWWIGVSPQRLARWRTEWLSLGGKRKRADDAVVEAEQEEMGT